VRRRHCPFLADNGGNWFVSGASDARFSDDDLDQLKAIPGTAFEVIKLGMLYK
jgi:hypothetical protein